MPNARNVEKDAQQRILLAGLPGTGKTIQFTTLPGRKFVYVFDPNCLPTLRGRDIDYECFLPDIRDIDLGAKPLNSKAKRDKSKLPIEPRAYPDWEEHFEKALDEQFFDQYDWVGFDGFTNLLHISMDRLLFLNDKTGQQPDQADWAAQVQLFTNVFRVLTAQKCNIFATAHIDVRQDDLTKKIFNQLVVTGQLRTRLPQMFTNIFVCHPASDERTIAFEVQTRSNKDYPYVRCDLEGLAMYEDVTIPDFSMKSDEELQGYGLNALLNKAVPKGGSTGSDGTKQKRK